jgi:4-amino-4-deoxy-L-arabinose transferase-like glycosyltransferase
VITSLNQPAPYGRSAPVAPGAAAAVADAPTRLRRSVPWAILLITAFAATLRVAELDDVHGNTFYDAAVHSMGLSWHNFFFGAFDPSARLAIDKPPLALWLQVGSVKLFGFGSFGLKFPEALGGTLAVPLLYDAVRRAVSRPAGLAAALTLAVLPVSVLTARSDTMDSLTMMFTVAALWCTVRAAAGGDRRWLVLAGVAFGLAFNVKLLQAFLAVPTVAILYAIAAPVSWRRRAVDIALAGATLVVVSLSWAAAVSLAPGSHPFPVGSSDGTVWNAMFVFNGFGRATGNVGVQFTAPAGPFRLLGGGGRLGELLGTVLIAALAFGGVAAIRWLLRGRGRMPSRPPRLAGAFATAGIVWAVTGIAVFSLVGVLKVRYLEALAPALAAAVGIGLASLLELDHRSDPDRRASVVGLGVALACCCAYTFSLATPVIAWSAAALAIGSVAAAVLARSRPRLSAAGRPLAAVLALGSCLLLPLHESIAAIHASRSDSGGLYTLPAEIQHKLSGYLGPRTVGRRDELAVDEPLGLAPLIIHDARPILPLTSFGGRPLTTLGELQSAVRSGAVRYALLYRCPIHQRVSCTATATWVREHGVNVTRAAKLPGWLGLYELTPHSPVILVRHRAAPSPQRPPTRGRRRAAGRGRKRSARS